MTHLRGNMSKVAVFDLDDTLINLKEEIMIQVQSHLQRPVPHWSTWESHSDFENEVGITSEELIEICKARKVFRTVKPHLFAPYILRDLSLRGFHIVVVTSRHGFVPNAVKETEAYMEKHGLHYDELIVSHHGSNKIDYLDHYDTIDFAVDDQVKNCIDFADSGKVEHVFLCALPGNKNCTLFPRIHNLYQVYPYLQLE